MAWTKNLGKVKGETGDVYIPSVELDKNGYLSFTWKSKDTGQIITEKKIKLPVYIPTESDEDGYINFTATGPVVGADNTPAPSTISFYVKGDKGDSTPTHFQFQFPAVSNKEQIENPQQDVFYVINKKVYVYNGDSFITMEQFDFENYYTTEQVYSMEEIDGMLRDITNQVDLAQKLYDIDEIVNN